ncbi:hypothetical protein [Clostridium thermarum]|uniref:hypothetical protein n=1 Tax=Clostridium thermarum TaxID=1716543 RepID=UPI0013D06F4F|nr:hypothetical protein [Clostridium thermarum]
MRIKKKTAMLLSFALGSTLFATTAFAEVTTKSGYDQLKDAIKYTSRSLSETLSSYTADVSYELKDNGVTLSSENAVLKVDLEKQAKENTVLSVDFDGIKRTSYSYVDKKTSIYYDENEDTYNVLNLIDYENTVVSPDPFKESTTADIERIIDALVGNLKDYVVVNDNTDGSKEISGSLKESQIPALVNAVTSFAFKHSYQLRYTTNYDSSNKTLPSLIKDIFVKEASGQMQVSKDGLISSAFATATLSGKDDKNVDHDITLEVLVKISEINSTLVTKPDLTGKKVVESTSQSKENNINTKLYVGKFKNDIVIEKDNQFVKVGERILTIEKVEGNTIIGNYDEEFMAGFEDYAKESQKFNFIGEIMEPGYSATVYASDSDKTSVLGDMSFAYPSSVVHFYHQKSHATSFNYDGSFYKIFE